MSSTTEDIKRWYKNMKKNIVFGFGGKCCVCGYDKCQDAFDVHHIDPKQKSFAISGFKIKNKQKIYDECEKCIMLCANCHRELHAGIIQVNTPVRFDIEKIPVVEKKIKIVDCEVCGKETKNGRFCSPKCCGEYNRKSGLTIDEIVELKKTKSFTEIGNMCGVSEAAIRKRYNKFVKR